MKTTKKLIVLCLVLVMGLVAVMPSTFSWYDHNGSHSGVSMNYHRNNLPVSAGTISVITKKYRMDGDKVYYDKKGNKEYADDGNAISSGSVSSGHTQYYGTTFTNIGSSPAYINLYLKNFTNNPKNFIGTIAPSLTYKGISSSVHIKNRNMVRVYFQFDKATGWNTQGAKIYVVHKTKAGTQGCTQITSHLTAGASGSDLLARQTKVFGASNIAKTYYADLPDNTVEFFFSTDANSSGFNTSNYSTTKDWYRTRTITNVQAEKAYYLTGVADDTTWNAQYASFDVPGGISVMTSFDKATMAAGQKAYITLSEGTHFTGEKAEYSVVSGNVTVNANTGLVSASNSFTNGSTATVRTTITGSMGDTTTAGSVDTDISNPATLSGAAVSTNIKVPAQTQDAETGESIPGKAEVVWFITNDTSSSCSFESVYYTK